MINERFHCRVASAMLAFACLASYSCTQSSAVGGGKEKGTSAVQQADANTPQVLNSPIADPRIVVHKAKRELQLFSKGVLVRTYRVGLGFNPVDDKTREGDGCTPEGEFYIFTKNPRSNYYLSLGISYPNSEDAARGLRDGLITQAQHNQIVAAIRKKKAPPQNTPLGGLIYIHGHGSTSDWTLGCVAVENQAIKELFAAVQVGTPVVIKP